MKWLFCLLLPSVAFAGNYFSSEKLPAEVQSAHEYFLQGDFDRMVLSIKEALMANPGDSALQSDLLDLYDKAYEVRGYDAVSPDWKAPGAISWLAVTAKKKYSIEHNRVEYRLQLSVEFPLSQELEQAQVIRYPDEVLLDRQAGKGQLTVKPYKGKTDFWMGADYHRGPNAPGLYLLTLKMRGSDPVHGWFLLGNEPNSSGSPEITWPKPDQVVASSKPTFTWTDFLSTEYKPFEHRRVIVSVIRRAEDAVDNTWLMSAEAPLTSATVGATAGDIQGAAALPPNPYSLHVSFSERRKFGDLRIGRDSGTVVPFSVKY